MTPRKQKNLRRLKTATKDESLRVQHPHAAGIDVHSKEHWVCVPAGSAASRPNQDPHLPAHVRCFGTYTIDLELLADWLQECGVDTVAMESTGVYWIPLFELLERRGFKVYLVDPRQARQVSGRPQSDVLSCQWIQRLHSFGLLAASFQPDEQVAVLRSYLRQRQMLIEYGGRHIQHMQKALEQMNVKLTEVIADITGKTGLAIIKDIVRGRRNPDQLARHRHERCKCSEAEIALALQGNWRDDHLFALKQALKLWENYQKLLRDCDDEIAKCLQRFADKSAGAPPLAPKRQRLCQPNKLNFDGRCFLHRMSGVDLTMIEGLDESTALVILSEIGLDMSKWPTEKHFKSWLALCPQHRGSAGKIKNRRLRGGANRAARAFRLAGQSCHHAKNALGAFYRRIQARCGGPKAVIATAAKIAERVYRLLKYGQEYVRQAMDVYETNYKIKLVRGLARKAKELGYGLVPAEPRPLDVAAKT